MLLLVNAAKRFFISNAVTKSFKLNSKLPEKPFLLWLKKVLGENSKPAIDRLYQINNNQNAKHISTFDFNKRYTKLPHKDLLEVLLDLIAFGFDESWKKNNDFSLKYAFWSNKPKSKSFFTKTSLKRTVQLLIQN